MAVKLFFFIFSSVFILANGAILWGYEGNISSVIFNKLCTYITRRKFWVIFFHRIHLIFIFPDVPLNRVIRSPHCISCENGYDSGYPPYFGYHRPRFHTHQWSGLARSPDGSQQQVYSGAAAAADGGTQNTGGSQAFSIASSNAGGGGYGYHNGGYGDRSHSGSSGNAGGKLDSGNEQQQVQLGGSFGNGESSGHSSAGSSAYSQGDNNANLQQQQQLSSNHFHSSGNEGGKFDSGNQQQVQSSLDKGSWKRVQNLDAENFNSGKSTAESSLYNNNAGLQQHYSGLDNGNNHAHGYGSGRSSYGSGRGFSEINSGSHSGHFEYGNLQTQQHEQFGPSGSFTNGNSKYNQHGRGDIENLEGSVGASSRGNNAGENLSYTQQQQAVSSGFGHGDSFNHGGNAQGHTSQGHSASGFRNSAAGSSAYSDNGQQQAQLGFGSGQHEHSSQSQWHEAGTSKNGQDGLSGHGSEQLQLQNSAQGSWGKESQSKLSGGSKSDSDDAQSSLSGALKLTSQGLQASNDLQNSQPTDCSTCGKGSLAYSNAKSHSGSAVALSVGG